MSELIWDILGRAPIKSNVQNKSLKFMAADTIIENKIENVRIVGYCEL